MVLEKKKRKEGRGHQTWANNYACMQRCVLLQERLSFYTHEITLYFFCRAAEEEESPRAGIEEEVQEELGLLGLREEDPFLDPQDGEEAVVLLVRHRPRLPQHLLSGGGALRPAGLAHRVSA